LKVVARELGIGPIDDADGALQARFAQNFQRGWWRRPEIQQERWNGSLVADVFIALRDRGQHGFDLHWAIPIRGGRNSTGECSKSDGIRTVAILLAAQVTE